MRLVVWCIGFFMTTTACALPNMRLHTHADYLNEAVGHADHDGVAKKIGAPTRVVALENGGDIWTYEFCDRTPIDSLNTPSTNGTVTYRPNSCQSLNLVFDNSGTLAEWRDK